MIETGRLYHRKFTLADLPRLIEMRAAFEVNQYLGGTRLQNTEAITKRMDFYISCYEKYGFGVCAIIWKPTNEMIGWSGLMPLGENSDIEVGYGMIKEFWGRGIGTETARAWLDFGFHKKNLERIVAVAYPENVNSRRIMEKLGMKFEKTAEHHGAECVFYAISREEFDKFNK